jgi:hypothetical protein
MIREGRGGNTKKKKTRFEKKGRGDHWNAAGEELAHKSRNQ